MAVENEQRDSGHACTDPGEEDEKDRGELGTCGVHPPRIVARYAIVQVSPAWSSSARSPLPRFSSAVAICSAISSS